MSAIPSEQLKPNDASIPRNRIGRWFVLILYVLLVFLICAGGAAKIGHDWFSYYGGLFGFFAGLAVSVVILSATLDNFFIRVDLVSAFVTTDLLYTLKWRKNRTPPTTDEFAEESEEDRKRDQKAFPSYGPGLHVAYPWEDRQTENNVSLKEVSAAMTFSILLSDGLVMVIGSYRIRADLKNLIPFLGGVASAPDELQDLIIAFAFNFLKEKTVDEAMSSAALLTDALKSEFGLQTSEGESHRASDQVSKFERRFGIFVGDITISKVLPTEEVQRTRSSLQEAKSIAIGTAELLGYPNLRAMHLAQSKGKVTADQIARARDRFMSVSGNLEGMQVTRWEGDLNIAGLDPEAVKEIARAVKPIAEALQPKGKGKK